LPETKEQPAIPEDRPLSEKEVELVRWLLTKGEESAVDCLSQVDNLWVISRCGCGCASIDFSVDGAVPDGTGIEILSDYSWGTGGENLCGIFVFARNKKLAGLEVWSIDGSITAPQLPDSNELRPLNES